MVSTTDFGQEVRVNEGGFQKIEESEGETTEEPQATGAGETGNTHRPQTTGTPRPPIPIIDDVYAFFFEVAKNPKTVVAGETLMRHVYKIIPGNDEVDKKNTFTDLFMDGGRIGLADGQKYITQAYDKTKKE